MPPRSQYRSLASSLDIKNNILYLDTSFLIDLLRYSSNPSDRKFKACRNFYEKLIYSDTTIWTSPLALMELLWKFLQAGIKTEMANMDVSIDGLSVFQLKKNHPAEYNNSFIITRPIIDKTIAEIEYLGIKIDNISPLITEGRDLVVKRILKYMQIILNKYVIESADALHIATAVCCDVEWIASNDMGFQNVSEIKVYGYNKLN